MDSGAAARVLEYSHVSDSTRALYQRWNGSTRSSSRLPAGEAKLRTV